MTLRHGSPGRTKSNDDGSKLLDFALHDVQRFIAECQTSWRMMGSLRHWGIWSLEPDVLVGGVELRSWR